MWINSYVTNRKQKIKVGYSFSYSFHFPFGVPQWSGLSPLVFLSILPPLSQVSSSFSVTHHLYADDIQIYSTIDYRNFNYSIVKLSECILSVQEWMNGMK